MDFKSLNRRELQSLCKLNKIPANITNVAMADALKSLDTVVGIEDILNPLRSETDRLSVESSKTDEITSPRVSCTSYRASTCKKVKKSEKESLLATTSRAGRGVRRQLAGEGNDFLKTPSVSGARKKGAATVQRVYNTRRSARLSEKKCNESGVTERGISQSVKIVSFLEEVSVASETSVGSGFSSVETSNESSISFENTEDDVGEGSIENCDEGILKAQMEDVCIEFEKLGVIIDRGEQNSVIEKVDFCDENVGLEEKQKVDKKFKLNERETFEEKNDQVDNIKPCSRGISNSIESVNLEEKLLVVDEKIDPHEALNVLVMEENDYLASEQHSVSFPCDKVLSETDGSNADSISCDIENSSDPLATVSDVKNGIDLYEDLNVSLNTHGVSFAPDEDSCSLFCDLVLSSDNFESDQNSVIEKVDSCGENVDLEEKQKVEEKINLNVSEISEEKSSEIDNIKPYSEGILNPHENVDLEDKLMVVDKKNDTNEVLHVSVMEQNDCLASEEHSESLPHDKVLSETDGTNADSISCDTENPSDSSWSVSDVKNGIDLYEDLNVSFKTHNVYLAPDEHSDSFFCDVVLSSDYFESDQNSVITKADCSGENVNLEEKQKVEEKFNLNESETFEEKGNKIDNIKPCSQGISNPHENVDLEEKLRVVDEKTDPHEELHASVMEPNDYLASEEHPDSLLLVKVLSETDGTNADSISCDIENQSDPSGSVSDVINGIDLYEELNVSLKTHNGYLAPDEHSDILFCDVVLSSGYFESDQSPVIEKADCCGENMNLEEKQKVEDKFNLNESETSEEKSKIDNIKPCSQGISNPHENVDLEDKLRVVDKKTDPHEELHVSVMEQNDYLASEEHTDSLLVDKVVSETDGTNGDSISCDIKNQSDPSGSVSDVKNEIDLYEELNVSLKTHDVYLAPDEHSDSLFCDMVLSDAKASCADSISCDTENPSDFLVSVLNMSNEILECNGSTYHLENASEMSKLVNADDHIAPEKITAEAERIVVNIFTNTVDDALVNPNEQEPSKDFETPEEAYESLIKETVVDKLPTIYQETDETKADADKETLAPPHDVINHPSHLIPRKNQTLNNIEVSDPNENNIVEDDKIITKKAEDEKPINLNKISMRQLKKQLKALSIKNNMNTKKYDMVVEARPVLQVVCDNHLTSGDKN